MNMFIFIDIWLAEKFVIYIKHIWLAEDISIRCYRKTQMNLLTKPVYIYSFPGSLSMQVATEYWVDLSVLYSRFLVVIYSVYSSIYILIIIS